MLINVDVTYVCMYVPTQKIPCFYVCIYVCTYEYMYVCMCEDSSASCSAIPYELFIGLRNSLHLLCIDCRTFCERRVTLNENEWDTHISITPLYLAVAAGKAVCCWWPLTSTPHVHTYIHSYIHKYTYVCYRLNNDLFQYVYLIYHIHTFTIHHSSV